MEYEEELVRNVLAIARNAIVSVVKKVENNILHVITTPVFMLQPTLLQDPVTNPLYALFKAPNTLVIK